MAKRIREEADYDFGHTVAGRPQSFKISAYDFRSRSDMKVRQTGNYGDNAMHDPSLTEAEEDTDLNRLRVIFNNAGIEDREIANGINLTRRGQQKVAAQIGIPLEQVEILTATLATSLRKELGESLTHEKDALGNVAIRDTETNKETFVRGSKAADLLKKLDKGTDEDTVLAPYKAMLESALDETDEEFFAELTTDSGSYNFPWKIDGQFGFATARFHTGAGGKPVIKVVDVRDSDGDPIADAGLKDRLHSTAVAYIKDV